MNGAGVGACAHMCVYIFMCVHVCKCVCVRVHACACAYAGIYRVQIESLEVRRATDSCEHSNMDACSFCKSALHTSERVPGTLGTAPSLCPYKV